MQDVDTAVDAIDPVAASYDTFAAAMRYISSNLRLRRVEDELAKLASDRDENIKPEPCASFDKLIECIGKRLSLNDGMIETYAVMLAINVSLKLGGVPLWSHIIGPPSSGKSTLSDLIEAAYPYVYSVSKFTGVHSGFAGRQDAGMVEKWNGKNVMIKDFTTILKMPPGTIDNIFGDLRDLYDGRSRADFRNRVGHGYHGIHFTMTTCTTEEIRIHNTSTVGERFIHCEIDSFWSSSGRILRYETNEKQIVRRATLNTLSSVTDRSVTATGELNAQKCMTWGFLDHIHTRAVQDGEWLNDLVARIASNEGLLDYVEGLARWTAFSRSLVKRDRDKQILWRPRAEYPNRLASQLMKLLVALCVVFQIDAPDDRVLSIVRKVALDTGNGFPLEIMMALAHAKDKRGATRQEIAKVLELSETSIGNRVRDLIQLGIVAPLARENDGQDSPHFQQRNEPGRPANYYRLTDSTLNLARTLGFAVPASQAM